MLLGQGGTKLLRSGASIAASVQSLVRPCSAPYIYKYRASPHSGRTPQSLAGPMASQISLHVKVTIDPSNVDQFLEHCKPVVGAVTAEPECTYFEIFQDPTNPGSLKYIENWSASIDWLQNVSVLLGLGTTPQLPHL